MTDKVNILVVDDLPEKFLIMESILAELGENLVYARSGDEALRRVLERDYAVILLDVNMPGMDGFETAAFIRRRKKSAHTPIIFMTAYADEMHAAQGYSLGAVDYILAPVVPEVLRTKVKVFVDLCRMNEQVKRQADERVALARAEAARAAAEESTRSSGFLAEAGRVLSSSLDPEATARALARLVVPFLADVAAATVADERSRPTLTELAWLGQDGAVTTHTCPGPAGLPAFADPVASVLKTGRTELGADLQVFMPPDAIGPERTLSAVVHLPLAARGHRLGVLTLARGRAFAPNDLSLAEDLAGRAAIALDNARLYRNIQEGDRRKNEFLAMLAHELRNPLAPVRNAVQLLRMIGVAEPVLSQARDIIDRQVTHMARLIDDLLDMSRLSRGKILLRQEPLDLVPLVAAVVEDYRRLLEGAGLKMQLRLPDRPLWVIGDPTRLAQVVGNVVHNAEKFTDPGGHVSIHLGAEPQMNLARLSIKDSGIGMDEEMLRRLFEPFNQADGSLDRSRGGLGLGLALVRGLIDLHGGTVRASSPGLGKGTEIAIELPLVSRPDDAAPKLVQNGVARPTYRILLIEDNEDAAESMRVLLTLCGHQVEVAATGPAGVRAAGERPPEVVLCDIGLPGGMDGYSVARSLRAEPSLATTCLIALTGYGQEEDQRRSREAGFDLHLTKPVDFAELQEALAHLHGGRERCRPSRTLLTTASTETDQPA
jgi:signal transduction histidine kinase/DNA-binding response OmpR family regulator